MRRGLITGLLACLVLTGCADGSEGNDPAATFVASTSVPTGEAGTTIETAGGLEGVDPVLAEHASWFLHVLTTGELSEADYQERFTDSFKEQVAYQDFAPGLEPFTTDGWAVNEVVTNEENFFQADISPNDGEPVLRLSLRIDQNEKMSELSIVVAPVTELENPPTSLNQAFEALGEFGEATLLAADAPGGECDVIDRMGAEGVVPLGSAFKLWVLAALADAIESGDVSWDDTLTVTDELKSLPSGRLQEEEAGTTVSVKEAATEMISISDNTATDMLIDLLGRGTIEASLEGRMENPSATLPFLTTRELFILKFGDPDRLQAYASADVAARREMLEEIASEPLPGLDTIPTEPVAIHEVEWFATPVDVCGVMIELMSRSEKPGLEPIEAILTTNPGVPSEVWDTVAFKGGSENGVLISAWYVGDPDNARVLVSSVTNEQQSFRADRPTLIMAAARDLLKESSAD